MLAYQQKATGPNVTFADASLDELISEIDFFAPPTAETMFRQAPVHSPTASVMSSSSSTRADSDACDVASVGNSSSKSKKSKEIPKADYAVDHLDYKHLHQLLQPRMVEEKNAFPCKLNTSFKKKYFRFDNKSLQCFPGCSKFADVREARMLGNDHRAGGRGESFCTNAVTGSVMVQTFAVPIDTLRVVGRFLSATPEVGVLPESDAPLLDIGAVLDKLPEANCVHGQVTGDSQTVDTWGRQEVGFTLQPEEAWFFNMILPRHRRNAACAAHKVPLFVFELLVFMQQGQSFKLCARTISSPFEVASIRTLIREALSFRQQSLPGHVSKDMADDEEMDGEAAKPLAGKPVAIALNARRHLAANYSSTAQRVRLAEANRKEEEKKKKQELVIEIVPEPEFNSGMDIVSPVPQSFTFPPPLPLFSVPPPQIFGFPVNQTSSAPTSNRDVLLDFPDLFLSDTFENADPMFQAPEMNVVMNVFNAELNLDDDIP